MNGTHLGSRNFQLQGRPVVISIGRKKLRLTLPFTHVILEQDGKQCTVYYAIGNSHGLKRISYDVFPLKCYSRLERELSKYSRAE